MKLKKTEFLSRLERIGDSRSDFAHRCGISRQSMSAWINGDRNPKPNNVKIMADALHCGIEDIAEPSTRLESVAIHGDKFASAILGMNSNEKNDAGTGNAYDDLEPMVLKFIAKQLADQVQMTNQSEVGRKIGLSASQINRMTHGKADLSLFPIGSLIRLCPQIIDRSALTGDESVQSNDLASAIANIKALAEKITDINAARTVENMLKGLVGE